MGQDANEGYGNFSIFSFFFHPTPIPHHLPVSFSFWGASRSKTSGFSPISLCGGL